MNRIARGWLVASVLGCALAGVSRADTAGDKDEVWKIEQQQWNQEAAKDHAWIENLVHPNMHMWETGAPMPRDRSSLQHWARYEDSTGSILEHELLPISTTITGNVAVVQYFYILAREDYKKERETVTGHYTDILVKEGGKWLFIAWAGGDDPKK